MTLGSAPTPRVRVLEGGDIESAAEIARRSDAPLWDAVSLDRERGLPQARLTVVETYPGAVQGFAVVWRMVDTVDLLFVAVEPSLRRRGLARLLVQDVCAWGVAERVDAIDLEVRDSNEAARGLYASLGFEAVGRRRRYYADGEDAVLMRRPLATG